MRSLKARNELCKGCHVCELVCSYHHKGFFSRRASSIHVRRMERKGEFEVEVFRSSENGRPACNLCISEKIPFCVRFCTIGALTTQE